MDFFLKEPPKSELKEFNFRGLSLGDSEEKVIDTLGQPGRKDMSEYGFHWYVYNQDYSKFVMVGIQNNKIVGFYSNTLFQNTKGVSIESTNKEVHEIYGEGLEGILKGHTNFIISSDGQYDVYELEDSYTTIFYDIHNSSNPSEENSNYENSYVSAVMIIEKSVEQSKKSRFIDYTDEIIKGYELQTLDLVNAARVKFNRNPLKWHDLAAQTSKKHSADMCENHYFAHENLNNQSPWDRFRENGGSYRGYGENIAAGQPNAIMAHEGWMNSLGHRQNILKEGFTHLGVGVQANKESDYHVYYTENFLIP